MADRAVAERLALIGLELPKSAQGVRIADAGPFARFVIRGERHDVAPLIGVELPGEPCRATSAGGKTALWLGPDEWLVLAPQAEGLDFAHRLARLTAAAEWGVGVEVSHRNAGLRIDGPKAAYVLSAGCPLDLDVRAFPAGMCARTLFAKSEIVLWRTGKETFHIEVWRSFAPYVVGLLCEAMRDAA